MSDWLGDLSNFMNVTQSSAKRAQNSTNTSAGYGLEMDDFLMLMVATLQNQSIDETADTSDMLNQMVQMSVITAINNISSLVTESTTLNYAASLVGKEVTIGIYEGNTLKEIVGVVTGTGTLNGQQVIFIGDDIYYLTDIMAVGRLPASDEEKAGNNPPDGVEDVYEDKVVDGDGNVERVYPGPDGVFGTADDYYVKDVDGDGQLERVYCGQGGEFGTENNYYEKEIDGEVVRIYAGEDGRFGTEDDYYEKEVDGEVKRIYPNEGV